MWGYQRAFRGGARLRIERALEKIGLETNATVFLVGFATDPDLRHQICIEPEHGQLSGSHLDGVPDRAESLYRSDPDSRLLITDPRSYELHQRGLFLRARRRAISEAIDASGLFNGLSFFISGSAPINGYDVHTCVAVPANLLDALPKFDDAVFDRVYVGRSLQHEVIIECLDAFDKEIYAPDPGRNLLFDLVDEHLVTTAARRFVSGTVYRASRMPADLFDMVNEFSAMTYERGGAAGHLVISDADTLRPYLQITFQNPVPLREARSIRKILELTNETTSVLADYRYAYGLGSAFSDTNTVEVSITGHAKWELAMDGQSFLRVAYGLATLPKRPISRADFEDTVRRIVGNAQFGRIWQVIQSVQETGHGATIVISADPQIESERLSGQALPIVPDFLDPDQVARLASVDGAILIGPDSRCHAFGVILDGVAGDQGDRARGSRFNSSVRYHQATKETAPCVIVVISDDGLIDLVPSLEPQVARETVEDAVRAFCSYSVSDHIDGETWSRLDDAIVRLRFYLNEEQCARVNKCYENEMHRRLSGGGIALHRTPLQPDPRMDDSYFLADR